MNKIKRIKGGIPARIGSKFHLEIERIKKERIKKEKSEDKISTEKITNAIVRHKIWNEIANDLIKAKEEELEKIWG